MGEVMYSKEGTWPDYVSVYYFRGGIDGVYAVESGWGVDGEGWIEVVAVVVMDVGLRW